MAEKEQTASSEPKKPRSAWGTIGKILMYGWMFILIAIFGIVILISSLVQRC